LISKSLTSKKNNLRELDFKKSDDNAQKKHFQISVYEKKENSPCLLMKKHEARTEKRQL